MKKTVSALVFLVLCIDSFAGEDSKPADFVGVVQHLEGEAHWTKRIQYDPKQKIGFKTFFHYNDELEVKGNHLKLITSQRCVGVVYEGGNLHSPKQKSNPVWRVGETTSARWICPQGATESLQLGDRNIELQGAEVFYHDRQLYVVTGRALSQQGELKTGGLYSLSGDGWKLTKLWSGDAHDIWEFNEQKPKPKEALVQTEPEEKIISRWYLGPVGGGSGAFHNNSVMEDANYGAFGIRLMMSKQWGNRSWIYSFTYHDTATEEDSEPGPTGPQNGQTFNFSRSDVLNFEMGIRLWHDSTWSPYWKFGIAHEYLEIEIDGRDNAGNFFNMGAQQEYIHLTTALGVEKTFLTEWLGWGGLFVSAEINYYHSLIELEDNIDRQNYGGSSKPKELEGFPSSLSRIGLLVNFGGVLTF